MPAPSQEPVPRFELAQSEPVSLEAGQADTTPEPPQTEKGAPTPEKSSKEPHQPDSSPQESPDTAHPEPPTPRAAPKVGLTHHSLDGNRWVQGKGQINTQTQAIDINITGTPTWLVAMPWKQGSVWAVAHSDGRIEAFYLEGKSAKTLPLSTTQLPIGMPLALHINDKGQVEVLSAPSSKASKLTHPIPLSDGRLVFLEEGGDLVLWADGKEASRLSVKGLPDARILRDEKDRLLLLSNPTTRYAHNVLGDSVEAASITMIETTPQFKEVRKISIPDQRVVEGIAPIWADFTGDGKREIIVTLSDSSQGAQLVVYDESGKIIATSPAIGSGFRWRNQMAIAPFAPDGTLELVDVFTPHIGGPTEFFQLRGGALQRVAQGTGYTSHSIGSRNLDLGIAGDFDGDGQSEIILPSQDLTSLGMLKRSGAAVKVSWTAQLGGRLGSNLAATGGKGQPLLIGAALVGRIRIWGVQ